MTNIGENIKFLRENKKWTKKEMADRLGLKSYTTITKWEQGENHPRSSDLKILCDLFNVTSDYLLGISNMDDKECINYYKYFPVSIPAGTLENIDSLDENDLKWIAMSDSLMGKYSGSSDIYFVDVKGTSMNKVIEPGSRVGVKRIYNITNLKDRDIVLFSKDNEYSIKRFFNDKDRNRLLFKPESNDQIHTDIVIQYNEIDKVLIHGKVVLNISNYA